MVDLISCVMFIYASRVGRSHGSLFVGVLVGCFVVFTYLEGGRTLHYCMERIRNRVLRKLEVVLWIIWTAFMLWVSFVLPPFILSVCGVLK